MVTDETILVSVVTPSFNSQKTLLRTLQSVQQQASHEYAIEHLVIDAGSKDGTLDILEAFKAGNNHPGYCLSWTSEPDQGIADAFNKGIARASGELVVILNSDDWHHDDAIARMLGAHRQRLQQNLPAAILHGDMILHEVDSNHHIAPRTWGGRDQIGAAFWFDIPLSHPTCFVPRQIYEQVGLFDINCRVAMDYEWLLRAYLAGVAFEYLPHQIITHFQGGGASGQNTRLALREVYRAQRKHHAFAIRGTLAFVAKMTLNRIKAVTGLRLAPGRQHPQTIDDKAGA